MATVSFTRMEDGTKEDYALLDTYVEEMRAGLVDRLIEQLRELSGSFDGYKIDRLQHSLQSATRALRDGKDEEYVVCALLHDIGDNIAPDNHSEIAAAVLKPFVSEANHWMVRHHGAFQMIYYAHHYGEDPNVRERFRDSPYYEQTVEFCHKYDQNCFDPDYSAEPLETFIPMMRRIFGRAPFGGSLQP